MLRVKGTISDNGTTIGSKGGTELMYEGLLSRLEPDLSNRFNIICSRLRNIDTSKKTILWCHDTYDDPESRKLSDPDVRRLLSKIVFVSNMQQQSYQLAYGLKPSECIVLENAIEKFPDFKKEYDGQVRLIYHTTPHRGLNILLAAYEKLYEEFGDRVHLDVFSSFKIYGRESMDEPYKALFKACEDHPGITYHGTQPNSVVREALMKSHVFAYPSIWPETSCIAAIEALCSKNFVVAPNFGALPETIAGFGLMYPYHEDINVHANVFYVNLKNAVKNLMDAYDKMSPDDYSTTFIQHRHNNYRFSWDERIASWKNLLTQISS